MDSSVLQKVPWVRSNSHYDPATGGTVPGERVTDEAGILAKRPIVSSESRRAFVAVKAHIFGLGHMMEIYHVCSTLWTKR
jgi:hypothetical protein